MLESLETIRLHDALLDRGDPEGPIEADWPEADFIIGNPDFSCAISNSVVDDEVIGMRTRQGGTDALFHLMCRE
ncbi:MAG: hypothetical protein KY456_13465 [Chloroflexi bacterium]|nr:hypothetical protein [Chloroflexota bacterium]